MVINELPAKERFKRQNIILAGVWHGVEPDFNIFLKPFVDEINLINQCKLRVQLGNIIKNCTLLPIILSTDTPARC